MPIGVGCDFFNASTPCYTR